MWESAQSWKEFLVDLKARGLSIAPEVKTSCQTKVIQDVKFQDVIEVAPKPNPPLDSRRHSFRRTLTYCSKDA